MTTSNHLNTEQWSHNWKWLDFAISLLFHMYTDILHRLQIFRAHSLYKVLPLIKQKETNINRMYSYVRDTCFVRRFFHLCVCVVQRWFTFFIFTHRDKYILLTFQRLYKLIKQFKDTQPLPLLHTVGTWMYDSTLFYSVFIKQLLAFTSLGFGR